MPTPTAGYWVGTTRVPSVSTILASLGWGTDALLTWANNLGLAGTRHTDVRERAADIGTCAHAMIDASLHQRRFADDAFPPAVIAAARTPFTAYTRWAMEHQIEVIRSEFPLTSPTLRYGGTPDALVRMDRTETVLLDFKTSAWLFPKHIIQVCAYLDLIAENGVGDVHRAIVLRVGKDGRFTALTVEGETIAQGRDAFRALLRLHQVKAPLEHLTKSVNRPGAVPSSAVLTILGKELPPL